jgi:hypothetical protein
MNTKNRTSVDIGKAIRDAFFRSDRYRIRQNQNAVFGFDPGVTFVEQENQITPIANNGNM